MLKRKPGSVVSVFCKKGGVGKSTFISYLAHYHASRGKNVLLISADDQNSIFKIFGATDKVSERDDDYLDHYLAGQAELGDLLLEVRENLYLIKTLNTNTLSLKLTLERNQEKKIKEMLDSYKNDFFDYIFIDFPPLGNRLTEVLLDLSDSIMIIVGLDALGIDGFFNTIQYLYESEINLDNIKYILPNCYSKNKRAPKVHLDLLQSQGSDFTPNAKILPPLAEKSIIKNLQAEGISVFDEIVLNRYDQAQRDALKKDFLSLYSKIDV